MTVRKSPSANKTKKRVSPRGMPKQAIKSRKSMLPSSALQDRKGGTGWKKKNTMSDNRILLLKHIEEKIIEKGMTRREAIISTTQSLQLIVNVSADTETDRKMQKDINWLRKQIDEPI